ncbi:MAG: FIST signal transduction protein [Vicinamibacterales bacterium]
MKVEQHTRTPARGWSGPPALPEAQLVLVFGRRQELESEDWSATLRDRWPAATMIGCSTAGQIAGTQVFDEGAAATAIEFAHTTVRVAVEGARGRDSSGVGARLAAALAGPDLKHVLLLSEGLAINADRLLRGLGANLPEGVAVTGGLAADGEQFSRTIVLTPDGPHDDVVAAVGLYGDRLHVGYGSVGGWDPFGPERLVTRSSGNQLYELDGQSALGLYKKYLGEHAAALPASGLLFPLSLRTREAEAPVVRTILRVDEADQSMTFAGDVPEGGYVRLMKANFDRLIDGAILAGRVSAESLADGRADLALLISCVGRRMVLRQRVEEEVEGVRDIVGAGATLAGFYSYGEICPFVPRGRCELHNQTMTVTTFSER